MRYESFKACWQATLRESGLLTFGFPKETLELDTLDRRYEVVVEPRDGQDAEPFLVTATPSWRLWALHTARTISTEEDLLSELEALFARVRRALHVWMECAGVLLEDGQ